MPRRRLEESNPEHLQCDGNEPRNCGVSRADRASQGWLRNDVEINRITEETNSVHGRNPELMREGLLTRSTGPLLRPPHGRGRRRGAVERPTVFGLGHGATHGVLEQARTGLNFRVTWPRRRTQRTSVMPSGLTVVKAHDFCGGARGLGTVVPPSPQGFEVRCIDVLGDVFAVETACVESLWRSGPMDVTSIRSSRV